MNIAIKYTNITSTDSIKDYIESRLAFLSKFISNEDTICHVEVGRTTDHHKQGDIFKAEVRVMVHGKEFYVTSEKVDLYSAIDDVKNVLTRDIVSSKEKHSTFIRRSGAKVKNLIKGLFNKGEQI
ncbi:MAG: ribosome-associated translation inhibitor RaiA [bacterium]|nr:ribosome-associated translation inhibitor RaiA [bacterium]